MATRIEDPQLGTLIKIEDVSSLTGIPKSTIRLWRRDQYRHLAKFDEYTHESSNAVWYRLADVENWLRANGKDVQGNRTMFTRVEAPNGVRAPLAEIAEGIDPRKHQALTEARKFNRHNHEELRMKAAKDLDNRNIPYQLVREFAPALTEAWFKGETPVPFSKPNPLELNGWFPAFRWEAPPAEAERAAFMRVNIARLFCARHYGWDLDVSDLIDLPY